MLLKLLIHCLRKIYLSGYGAKKINWKVQFLIVAYKMSYLIHFTDEMSLLNEEIDKALNWKDKFKK